MGQPNTSKNKTFTATTASNSDDRLNLFPSILWLPVGSQETRHDKSLHCYILRVGRRSCQHKTMLSLEKPGFMQIMKTKTTKKKKRKLWKGQWHCEFPFIWKENKSNVIFRKQLVLIWWQNHHYNEHELPQNPNSSSSSLVVPLLLVLTWSYQDPPVFQLGED